MTRMKHLGLVVNESKTRLVVLYEGNLRIYVAGIIFICVTYSGG